MGSSVRRFGDFNGDGKLDLAISGVNQFSSNTAAVYLLAGKGDGTFQAPTLVLSSSGSLAAADVNGDGKPDLALATSIDPATCQVYLGNGDGTFSDPKNYGISVGPASAGPSIADLNNDGKLDIAAGAVLLGNGDGTFHGIPLGGTSPPTAAVVGDFEKKGALDVAIISNTGGRPPTWLF